jgi:capsular polysaccharide export protein
MRYWVPTYGIHQNKTLPYFFPQTQLKLVFYFFSNLTHLFSSSKDKDSVLAWGRKPSHLKSLSLAKRLKCEVTYLEDGFLRSMNPGDRSPYSLVVDDLGIYYDSTSPSHLELLIAEPLTEAEFKRAQFLIELWRSSEVSKYNSAPSVSLARLQELGIKDKFVLVIDQTDGDLSIEYGQASRGSFKQMIEAALLNHPDKQIVVKTHPECVEGKKKSCFDDARLKDPRIVLLSIQAHLPSLFRHCFAVYTVTSQAGFEALLWGLPVHTFGMPFYAEWGLSTDQLSCQRRSQLSLEQLTHACLVRYPRYIHPESLSPCEVEDLIQYFAWQRRCMMKLPSALNYSFSVNKSKNIQAFSQFSKKTSLGKRLQWGASELGSNGDSDGDGDGDSDSVRVEDGFIRSVGLGAELSCPLSLIFDQSGIYFDARSPSDLENLLNNRSFTDEERSRGRALRKLLSDLKISKYNLPTKRETMFIQGGYDNVILVPGQVESDASLRYGSNWVSDNLSLLKVVRTSNPNAFLIYKEHPDIVAGMRKNESSGLRDHCDVYVDSGDICDWLGIVDQVHTMTSLAGFEALVRGKKVFCYGHPFYAGWGLTKDIGKKDTYGCFDRRSQRTRANGLNPITIDELVYATLVEYPLYIHPKTGLYTTPEEVIQHLYELKSSHQSLPKRLISWIKRMIGKTYNLSLNK